MDSDSRAGSSVARDGDVDETPLRKELPQGGGADVAQNRSGAACEHRGHPLTLLAQSSVPDRVHPAMNAVQSFCSYSARSAALADPGAFELRKRDHAVLISRNPGYDGVRIGIGEFRTHGGP